MEASPNALPVCAPDPSLRLKNGYGQDDADSESRFKLHEHSHGFDRSGVLPYNKKFGLTRISLCRHEGNEPAMANHLSALKRARQTERRTVRNRANTSTLRTQLRVLREAIEKGDKAAAEQTYRQTVSALDKAIQKGTLHENTASRYKSRLGVRVNAMK